jgi:hypothetical protein
MRTGCRQGHDLALLGLGKTGDVGSGGRRNLAFGHLLLKLGDAVVADDCGARHGTFGNVEHLRGIGPRDANWHVYFLLAMSKVFDLSRNPPALPF